MPALRAALGLAPTVRNSNPVVLRASSHHTAAAAASAIRKPTPTCGGGPPTCGNCAEVWMFGVTRFDWPGCCSALGVPSR